jgi:hypothetical protein
MTAPTVIINKFVGGQHAALEWPAFFEHLQQVALNTFTPNPSGLHLLGTILSAAQWTAHTAVHAPNLVGPFALIPHPGVEPPDAADPAVLVRDNTFYNRYKVNAAELAKWERETQAVLAFRTALLASLDEPSRRLLADPGGGTAVISRTLPQMVERLARQYGHVAPSQIAVIAHQLDDIFVPGTDMLAFLAHHTEIHRILALSGEILQDGTKIRHAREAITKGAGPIYDVTIANVEERCRTANPPSRLTWDAFVDSLVAASLRLNTHATMGSSGYGAGAVKGPPSPWQAEYGHPPIDRDQLDIASIASSLAALTAQLSKLPPGPNLTLYCLTQTRVPTATS